MPEPQVREFLDKLVPSQARKRCARPRRRSRPATSTTRRELLAMIPRDLAIAARIEALEQGIAFAQAGAGGPSENELREKLGIDPLDHDARIKLAGVSRASAATEKRWTSCSRSCASANATRKPTRRARSCSRCSRSPRASPRSSRSTAASSRARCTSHAAHADHDRHRRPHSPGLLWPWLSRLGLGRLPGDFRIQTGNSVFYFPLATCLARLRRAVADPLAAAPLRQHGKFSRVCSRACAWPARNRALQSRAHHEGELLANVDATGCDHCERLCLAASLGLPVRALAQPAATVEDIDVIGTTPLGASLDADRVAGNVQTATAAQIREQGALDLADFMKRNLGSVFVNDAQSNPLQPDVQYRGFVGSPLLGLPQGLAVYQDGVRINEPFGDTVNWALIPESRDRHACI